MDFSDVDYEDDRLGKTNILDKFAREQYQQYIYINMIGESGEYFLECYEKAYHRRNVQDEAENGMAAVLKTYAPNFVDSRETIVGY